MITPAVYELIGRWRIVDANMLDRDYLDLIEPAHLTSNKNARGTSAFGTVKAAIELEYTKGIVFLHGQSEIAGELEPQKTWACRPRFRRGFRCAGRSAKVPACSYTLRLASRRRDAASYYRKPYAFSACSVWA